MTDTTQAYTIKPLVWEEENDGRGNTRWCLRTPLGTTHIVYAQGKTDEQSERDKLAIEIMTLVGLKKMLTPLPPAGREIARWESEIQTEKQSWQKRVSCDCPQYQEDDGEQWCDFGFMDDGFPGPRCPNHAAPGTTPVEVIVREREVEP